MRTKIILSSGVLLFGIIVAVISFNGLTGNVDYATAKVQAVKLMEKHAAHPDRRLVPCQGCREKGSRGGTADGVRYL